MRSGNSRTVTAQIKCSAPAAALVWLVLSRGGGGYTLIPPAASSPTARNRASGPMTSGNQPELHPL